MGLAIPLSHGNLQITNYRGKYRGILPWNFTEKSLNNFQTVNGKEYVAGIVTTLFGDER